MLEQALLQGSYKIILAMIGLMMGRLCLYWFDKYFLSVNFTQWLENANDEAKAIYYGSRFMAVCLLVGLALS